MAQWGKVDSIMETCSDKNQTKLHKQSEVEGKSNTIFEANKLFFNLVSWFVAANFSSLVHQIC